MYLSHEANNCISFALIIFASNHVYQRWMTQSKNNLLLQIFEVAEKSLGALLVSVIQG